MQLLTVRLNRRDRFSGFSIRLETGYIIPKAKVGNTKQVNSQRLKDLPELIQASNSPYTTFTKNTIYL